MLTFSDDFRYEQKKLLENSEKINNKTKELDNDSNNFLTDTNKGPKSSSPQCDGKFIGLVFSFSRFLKYN